LRFYTIAIFIFSMLVASSWINQSDIFNTPNSTAVISIPEGHPLNLTALNQSVVGASSDYDRPESSIETLTQWGDFLSGASRFIQVIRDATVGIPFFLTAFGFPSWIANDLTIIVWVIYIAGIIQFLANRRL